MMRRYHLQLKNEPSIAKEIGALSHQEAAYIYASITDEEIPFTLHVMQITRVQGFHEEHAAEIEVDYKITTFYPETPPWSRKEV